MADAGRGVDRIFSTAIRGEGTDIVTSSMVYRYVESPFSLWCDLCAPQEEKDPIDAYVEHLFREGQHHEEVVVQEAYPGIVPVTAETEKEAFRIVLESMVEGVKAVHQAPLLYLPEGLKSRLDILERRDGHQSVFGDYHYIVKEVKSARNIKEKHILQAAFNNYILGKIQAYTPDHVFIINRDRDEFAFDYDESEVVEVIAEVRQVILSEEMDPVYGAAVWPWESYGKKLAIQSRDISLVGGIGPAMRERMVSAGIRTIDDLTRLGQGDLTKIKGVGTVKAREFSMTAQALVKEVHIPLKPVSFPTVKAELFLDLEGSAHQMNEGQLVDMDYLIGVLIRQNDSEQYKAFVAQDFDEEQRMFLDFVKWLAQFDDYVIYHWHYYEPTRLRRMARVYGLSQGEQTAVLSNLRDLHRDATQGFAFPTYGHSIKAIAPYVGFQWNQEDVSGTECVALYFDYVRDPESNRTNLEKIVSYNREDCEALRAVKDWIAANSRTS